MVSVKYVALQRAVMLLLSTSNQHFLSQKMLAGFQLRIFTFFNANFYLYSWIRRQYRETGITGRRTRWWLRSNQEHRGHMMRIWTTQTPEHHCVRPLKLHVKELVLVFSSSCCQIFSQCDLRPPSADGVTHHAAVYVWYLRPVSSFWTHSFFKAVSLVAA